jgi:oligopeptide/dipeptide ABC transporter ATP-binding protein
MYLGRIVELGSQADVCERPLHPYTRALISAVPVPDPGAERERARRYLPLAGEPPSPLAPPSGCHFHPRCPEAVERCRREVPELRTVGPGRQAACHLV